MNVLTCYCVNPRPTNYSGGDDGCFDLLVAFPVRSADSGLAVVVAEGCPVSGVAVVEVEVLHSEGLFLWHQFGVNILVE